MLSNRFYQLETGEGLVAGYEEGATVDAEALLNAGIVKVPGDGIKVLGSGDVTVKNLTVKAKVFSASAKEKIEAAGGKTEVI